MKRILVPLDFSLGSRAALRHAVALAERFGARVEVLHVWEPSPVVAPESAAWLGGDADTFWANLAEDLRKRLEALVAEEAPSSTVPIAVEVEPGYVAHTILRKLERGEYDLVVMGTHGRTGLSHVLVGSVAERVVRLSPVPVTTIRVAAKKARRHEAPREAATPEGASEAPRSAAP